MWREPIAVHVAIKYYLRVEGIGRKLLQQVDLW